MIDTHAHLNFPDYKKDLKQVIIRAQKAKVEKIICVGASLTDSQQAVALAKKFPQVIFAAVGIHPQNTRPRETLSLKEQIKRLEKLAQEKEVIAIGECGLDFSLPPPGEESRSLEEQVFLFQEQIKIAQKFDLPLSIHSRQAFKETINILSQFKTPRLKGVFHCYSGGKKGIKEVEKLGFFFGIDGNLTYDAGLQNVVALIPDNKILLETDSPFLAPLPHRGERNEPAFLPYIAQKLAEIKGKRESQLLKKINSATQHLFRFL
ncbi:TatD family hydrolase [bacterium]|nr:TatD family hydrolase [bacterium]